MYIEGQVNEERSENMDLMLITATENIDENQIFFERKNKTYEPHNRLYEEYELDSWDIFSRIEGEFNEKEKISNRCEAIRRIQGILQEIPSNK